MKNKFKNIAYIIGLFILISGGCKEVDPVIEELKFDRVFTPVNLTALIRNKTTVELNWNVRGDADHYVVELSEDSLKFTTIVKTVQVTPAQLPVSILLDGQTRYSARVKGVSSSGLQDSKMMMVTFKTDAENIFYTLDGANIGATSVTLKWPAGSEATNFLILPGNVSRNITATEIAAGSATITGLIGETNYTVRLMKGPKQRGSVAFKTLIDLGGATPVYPENDLNAIIANANAGDVLVLFPGEYKAFTGKITLNKSISIKGLYPYNKPILHIQFVLESGVQEVEVRDVEMSGTYIDPLTTLEVKLDHSFQYNTASTVYGNLKVIGCNIHDFTKSLFSASSVASSVTSILMDNSIVTNILTDAADFIDFRTSYLGSITLRNSTFNNCAPARDFIRLDDASATYPGKESKVEIDHCTLYQVSNNAARRLLYVRFKTNTLKVTNTIIAETLGYYTNQSSSAQPECSMNNYYNAPGFITGGSTVAGAKFDLSGNHTVFNPGFADPSKGNFKLTNQTLIDKTIGDPRWKP